MDANLNILMDVSNIIALGLNCIVEYMYFNIFIIIIYQQYKIYLYMIKLIREEANPM